jgi:two-component system CheB/CheR fusion protein
MNMSKNKQPSNKLYHVCIGASAGGLEAIREFFLKMPSESGLTFIVIQHLSPDYKSMMLELLESSTSMPITMAEEGVKPEQDHIYLIPRSTNLRLSSDGTFALEQQERSKLLPVLPIDIFFESMAKKVGERAIGVVLTGTGSDGTKGARYIREAGGIVLVQDYRTARFDGMPKSIFDNRLADYVDEIDMLPKRIIEYVSHPLRQGITLDNASEETVADKPQSSLFNLLYERFRVDFSQYKPTTVGRRIERRIAKCGKSSINQYLDYCQQSPSEIEELFQELLIGVTNFFRDKSVYDALQNKLLPEYIEQSKRNEFRLWVPGCSTGEEAYSFAIIFCELCEKFNWDLRVKIFATDIDKEALAKASAGIYPQSIAADLPKDIMAKYFSVSQESFTIVRKIREMVVFARHDVLNDPPFTKIDVISCRNFLIYLKPEPQTKVMRNFSFSLKPGGVLVLGTSETLGEQEPNYEVLDQKNKIFMNIGLGTSERTLTGPREALLTHEDRSIPTLRSSALIETRRSNELRILEALIESLGREILPFTLLVDQNHEILRVVGDSTNYVLPIHGRLNNHIGNMLIKDLSTPVVSGLARAFRTNQPILFRKVAIFGRNSRDYVDVRILPVSIRGIDATPTHSAVVISNPAITEGNNANQDENEITQEYENSQRIYDLERELQFTRENLQATIEELETSNEELQATNEELLASNEELQSTNEELQSVNEELSTVNTEHQLKLTEMNQLKGDWDSLMSAANMSVIYLDNNLHIRSFTPQAVRVFNIADSDIGNPIWKIPNQLKDINIDTICKNIIANGQSFDGEFELNNNSRYALKINPTRPQNELAIDGVIIVLQMIKSEDEESSITLEL